MTSTLSPEGKRLTPNNYDTDLASQSGNELSAARRRLEMDWDFIRVGVAEYDTPTGATGCTVFVFRDVATCVFDVRGGAPATFCDRLRAPVADAVCFAGGSTLGLEACCGVARSLHKRGGAKAGWMDMPVVRGAIIFDLGARRNAVFPDTVLGKLAADTATAGVFPLGPVGAGASASVGNLFFIENDFRKGPFGEPCGQGGAFRQIGPVKVAVFTVVNAVGAIVDRAGKTVRGFRSTDGTHQSASEALDASLESGADSASPEQPGNTTLSLVVVNVDLAASDLEQLARQVHTSMARAIHPFHGPLDGDVLYAVSSKELPVQDSPLSAVKLGIVASELIWDAILSSFDPSAS